jgi:hypothetical protein
MYKVPWQSHLAYYVYFCRNSGPEEWNVHIKITKADGTSARKATEGQSGIGN